MKVEHVPDTYGIFSQAVDTNALSDGLGMVPDQHYCQTDHLWDQRYHTSNTLPIRPEK